jgi:hypothetical protein
MRIMIYIITGTILQTVPVELAELMALKSEGKWTAAQQLWIDKANQGT